MEESKTPEAIAPETSYAPAPEVENNKMSQDDIEALLRSAGISDSPAPEPVSDIQVDPATRSQEESSGGVMSQDEVQRMLDEMNMSGSSEKPAESAESVEPAEPAEPPEPPESAEAAEESGTETTAPEAPGVPYSAELAGLAEPTEPTEPAEPAEPVKTAEPSTEFPPEEHPVSSAAAASRAITERLFIITILLSWGAFVYNTRNSLKRLH